MHWIEGINNSSHGFSVEVVDKRAYRQRTAMVHMEQFIGTAINFSTRKVNTNFADWRRASAKELLRGYEFAPHVAERHEVFALDDSSTRYLIPAAVLVRALFRPFPEVVPYFFHPYGLERLCVPIDANHGKVLFWPRSIQPDTRNRGTIQRPLSWIWSFPSARRAWESLYRKALLGILGIDLPLAQAQLVLAGRSTGAAFLVNQIRVHHIDALESPFDMFSTHTREIPFHGRLVRTCKTLKRRHPSALPRNELGSWDLLEDEWRIAKAIIGPLQRLSRRARFSDREALAGILRRFGEDLKWNQCQFGSATPTQAERWHRELVRQGKWQLLATFLQQTRSTPPL